MFSNIFTSIFGTIPFTMMQPTLLARKMFELKSDHTFLCNSFSFKRYDFNCRKTTVKNYCLPFVACIFQT